MKNALRTIFILLTPILVGMLLLETFGRQVFDDVFVKIPSINVGGINLEVGPLTGYLGGYVLLLAITYKLFTTFTKLDTAPSRSHRRKLDNVAERLLGDWFLRANFQTTKAEAIERRYRSPDELSDLGDNDIVTIAVDGTCSISKSDDQRLNFNGNWVGQHSEGSWHADEIILKTDRLYYMFAAPNPDHGNIDVGGVTRLHFNLPRTGKLKEMRGTWRILGEKSWGNIQFQREKFADIGQS